VIFPLVFTTFALAIVSSPRAVVPPITLRLTSPEVPASNVRVCADVPLDSASMLPREIIAPLAAALVVSIFTLLPRDALPVQLTLPPDVTMFAVVLISDTTE
jgi:hypothetical protein